MFLLSFRKEGFEVFLHDEGLVLLYQRHVVQHHHVMRVGFPPAPPPLPLVVNNVLPANMSQKLQMAAIKVKDLKN